MGLVIQVYELLLIDMQRATTKTAKIQSRINTIFSTTKYRLKTRLNRGCAT